MTHCLCKHVCEHGIVYGEVTCVCRHGPPPTTSCSQVNSMPVSKDGHVAAQSLTCNTPSPHISPCTRTCTHSPTHTRASDRAFLLDWQDAPRLTDYLMPNTIDWATPLHHVQLPPVTAFHDLGSWKAVAMEGKNATWYRTTDFTSLLTQPVEVIQAPVYDFTYAVMSNPQLMAKSYALRMDVTRCHLCCVWPHLFKFNRDFEQQMNKSLEQFGASFERLVALQLRSEAIPSKDEARMLMECAGKAAGQLSSALFTIASNNKLVTHLIRTHTGYDGLFVQPEDSLEGVVHVHMGTRRLPSHDKEKAVNLQRVTFQHFYLLLKAAVLVRGVGHKASLGVVADALRRHIGTRSQSYVIKGNSCTSIAPGYRGTLF